MAVKQRADHAAVDDARERLVDRQAGQRFDGGPGVLAPGVTLLRSRALQGRHGRIPAIVTGAPACRMSTAKVRRAAGRVMGICVVACQLSGPSRMKKGVPGTAWPAAWSPAARPVSGSSPGVAHPPHWGLRRASQAQLIWNRAFEWRCILPVDASMGPEQCRAANHTAAPAAAVWGVRRLDGQLLLALNVQASLGEGRVEPVVEGSHASVRLAEAWDSMH